MRRALKMTKRQRPVFKEEKNGKDMWKATELKKPEKTTLECKQKECSKTIHFRGRKGDKFGENN